MAEEKNPTKPSGPAGGGGGAGGAGGAGGGAGGGGEKPRTLEMRVAEVEDKLARLTGGSGGQGAAPPCNCDPGAAAAAPCGYCYCGYCGYCYCYAGSFCACTGGGAAQAAPPCVAAQASMQGQGGGGGAAPPCVAAQAAAPPPCIASAGCIADCVITSCWRCIIRCIIPIFHCINECGGGLPGGPVTGGFGGFGR